MIREEVGCFSSRNLIAVHTVFFYTFVQFIEPEFSYII